MMYYDISVKTPFSLSLSGASGSGKTTFLDWFIQNFSKITDGSEITLPKLLWFSRTNQPELFKRSKSSFPLKVV